MGLSVKPFPPRKSFVCNAVTAKHIKKHYTALEIATLNKLYELAGKDNILYEDDLPFTIRRFRRLLLDYDNDAFDTFLRKLLVHNIIDFMPITIYKAKEECIVLNHWVAISPAFTRNRIYFPNISVGLKQFHEYDLPQNITYLKLSI